MKDWKACIVCQWATLHNMLNTDVSSCVSSDHRKSRVEFLCPGSENPIELQRLCEFPYQIKKSLIRSGYSHSMVFQLNLGSSVA